MAKTTSGVETGIQSSGIDFSLLLKGIAVVIVIAVVGMILVSSPSGNDAGKDQERVPDPGSSGVPVAGGAAGGGIVTLKETSREIGYSGIYYPIDNVPNIIIPRGGTEDGLRVINLRYENGKIKFCVKDSMEKHTDYHSRLYVNVGLDTSTVQEFLIVDMPKGKIMCYETHYDISESLGKHAKSIYAKMRVETTKR
ncbi:MAG: hypothetical protein U9P70_02005 [Patescibacteria group bacterium]|nr:hypothetical protein [Patescibacteria group bacterium]